MVEKAEVVSFINGELYMQTAAKARREVVLALPLHRLLVKMVNVPNEMRNQIEEFLEPIMQSISPYPNEELAISYEVLRETENGAIMLAASLPEGATSDIAEELDNKKLDVTRVDILELGALRVLLHEIADGKVNARRLVAISLLGNNTIFVLDDDVPCAVRAISNMDDLSRDVTLSLLEAEDFGGEKPLSECVVIGAFPIEKLEVFAPVRQLSSSLDVARALEGVAERTDDTATLNAMPTSWVEVLEETRFKTKLTRFLIVAGAIWLFIMAIFFSVPIIYGMMCDYQKNLSKEHARRYAEVNSMREKVRLVQKYSDHSRGSLEILKAVSDRLPEGVELTSLNFRREDGVKFSGEAKSATSIYQIKDRLLETKLSDDEESETLFEIVELVGPSAARDGKQRFDIDCKFVKEDK